MGDILGGAYDRLISQPRARVLAERLSSHLSAVTDVLDVGCGDGSVALRIKQRLPHLSIKGVDVLVLPHRKIDVERYDGKTLPCADKGFDAVLLVDMLHHTEDPLAMLREARRVARKLVLIKDHTMDGLFANATLRFMDWWPNRHNGVALSYNYWPERKWRDAFASLRMPIVAWESRIGLYPFPANLAFERHLQFIAALAPAVD